MRFMELWLLCKAKKTVCHTPENISKDYTEPFVDTILA